MPRPIASYQEQRVGIFILSDTETETKTVMYIIIGTKKYITLGSVRLDLICRMTHHVRNMAPQRHMPWRAVLL